MPDPSANPERVDLTTLHVRAAIGGDAGSLDWVITRLTPLLMVQAEYRLGPALRQQVDPEDLVSEAWLVALPRLAEFARHPRATPVLLKFLTTTMTFRVNHLLRRRMTASHAVPPAAAAAMPEAARATGVVTNVVRSELADVVRQRIDSLDPADREVLVLRGIEQQPSQAVAVMLAITPAAVDQRFSRALKRLRESLPDSAFEDLAAD